MNKITACVVVYNEEKIIEKCLRNIKDLADEIIVIHDGDCTDQTLEIAKKYTSQIYVRKHEGIIEPHLVFAYQQAKGDWLLRIDADEYIDIEDHLKIKSLLESNEYNAYSLRWEFWNGKKPISFPGVYKMCFIRKTNFHFCGIPHSVGRVDGRVKLLEIYLHHRPAYNNLSWRSFLLKMKKWCPIHAQYFFPEKVEYYCFQTTAKDWIDYVESVRRNVVWHMFFEPIRSFFGQLIHGQWRSIYGWQYALQHAVNDFYLYLLIWRIGRNDK